MERGKISIQYSCETHNISVDMQLANDTVWLAKFEIASLFDVTINAVTMNLKSLFKDNPILERDGEYCDRSKNEVQTMLYNLDVIIALSYRMKNGYCELFRQWVTKIIIKSVNNTRNPNTIRLSKKSN